MPEMIQEAFGGLVVIRGPLVEVAPPTLQDLALQTIARLEREQLMPRATREFMLVFMEAQAQEMGVSLETLMTKNALYRRVKQFDMQIEILREQLQP